MRFQYKFSKFPFFIKPIFARVWALWGLISFIVSFLIVLIPSLLTALIPDPKGIAYYISIARVWMKIWLNLVGCPASIKGELNFEKGKTYIVTCNHTSFLDAPLSSPFIPGANKTIAKKDFAKVPLFGWYYKRGSILVDRNSDTSRRKSFEAMKEALSNGFHMCVYPEGTRNRTGAPLKKFYDGAFKLAVNTGHSIIPAVIFNAGKALPANRFFYMMPQKLAIHFLEPISAIGKTTEGLKKEVYNAMLNYYELNKYLVTTNN